MGDFEWPWEYKFPPFFTIQLHAGTREQQLATWTNLVIKYHKTNKRSRCNINDDIDLFKNSEINRKLQPDGRLAVFEELAKRGLAASTDKKRMEWQVYWFPLEELGEMIYSFAVNNGMTNTVCTIFELCQGDATVNEEFYGIDAAVMILGLRTLEDKGKCELIISPDIEGVKFF